MALETFLLNIGKTYKSDLLENTLLYLLKRANSTSITAIVSSIVLAYPDKTFNIAKILFKSKELFDVDRSRMVLDTHVMCPFSN
jgi:hypothetical protein